MACFPILRSMAYGFVGAFVASLVALPLHFNGIISEDVTVGVVTFAYVIVGMGRLILCETK